MLYFLYVFYKYIFGVSFGLHSNKILTTFLPLKEKKKKIHIWGYVMEFPLLFQAIVR